EREQAGQAMLRRGLHARVSLEFAANALFYRGSDNPTLPKNPHVAGLQADVWAAIVNPMSEVTRVLSAIEQGDPHAAEQLLPLVYDELRRLAAHRLAREAPGQTLQATALVHEAYLRLAAPASGEASAGHDPHWNSRGHFFAAAAEAMR